MQKKNIEIGSNKSFGIIFFFIFLLIGIFPLFDNRDIRIWSVILSVIFLILGLLNSPILSQLNRAWFKFGILLGNFVSPIVMGVVFFIVVTPTALIMRALGKNLLSLKKNNKKTYWIEKPKIKSSMKQQF